MAMISRPLCFQFSKESLPQACKAQPSGLLTDQEPRSKTGRPMSTTERLYYNDSHLIEFEARVVDVTERVSGWAAMILNRTAFYPTGGGQPSDTGTLNGLRVVECIDDGEKGVLHVVQGATPAVGAIVRG